MSKPFVFIVVVVASVAVSAPAFGQEPPAEDEPAPVLFVQSAQKGSLVAEKGSSGEFALTLEGADARTFWFTDRPARRSGSEPTKAALDAIGFDNTPPGPPNAVLSLPGENERRNMVALTLQRPRYDGSDRTLRFDATQIPDVTGTTLESYGKDLDPSVPRTFGRATLFIDSAPGPEVGNYDAEMHIVFLVDQKSPAKSMKIDPVENYQCVDDARSAEVPITSTGEQKPVSMHITIKTTGSCWIKASWMTWKVYDPARPELEPTPVQIWQAAAGEPLHSICARPRSGSYPCREYDLKPSQDWRRLDITVP